MAIPAVEAHVFNRMVARNVGTRVLNRVAPLHNAQIAARTGVEPLVWVGGLSSKADDYLAFQRAWQSAGVPTYLTDTGVGYETVARNADELARTIGTALDETGASRVWVAGQSKGTIDARWALQHRPELLDSVNGAFLIVGPHHGGMTTSGGVASTLRGVAERVPDPQGKLRASTELLADSAVLRTLNDDLPRFLDEAPAHLTIETFGTSITPRGLPGHDGLVPLSSQHLGVEHARLAEHTIGRAPFHHITAHTNPDVTRVMASRIGAPGRVSH